MMRAFWKYDVNYKSRDLYGISAFVVVIDRLRVMDNIFANIHTLSLTLDGGGGDCEIIALGYISGRWVSIEHNVLV